MSFHHEWLLHLVSGALMSPCLALASYGLQHRCPSHSYPTALVFVLTLSSTCLPLVSKLSLSPSCLCLVLNLTPPSKTYSFITIRILVTSVSHLSHTGLQLSLSCRLHPFLPTCPKRSCSCLSPICVSSVFSLDVLLARIREITLDNWY